MDKRYLQVAVVIGVVSILLIPMTSAAVNTTPATEFHEVQNESIQVNVGTWQTVNESSGVEYYDNETVYNETGVQMTEGADYEWSTDNSSIYFYSTDTAQDGSPANITYSYVTQPEPLRDSVSIIGNAAVVLAALSMVVLASYTVMSLSSFDTSRGGV